MATEGDKNQQQALYVLGGKSLWTKELEVALLDGEVDILVHSLKDVPTVLPKGCELGAILEREDPADSLVVKKGLGYRTIEELPEGSVVGTSSVRRVAQLKRKFPKLVFKDVVSYGHFIAGMENFLMRVCILERKFVRMRASNAINRFLTIHRNTRLAKLDAPDGEYSALILAKAGMVRLDWNDRISSDIVPPTLYHAVGQAALAAEIRSNDPDTKRIVQPLIHKPTDYRCRAERAMLRVLEGGCSVPVGAATELDAEGTLALTGTVTSLGGDRHVEQQKSKKIETVEDAEALGEEVAKALIESGGREILDEVTKDRASRQAMGDKVLAAPLASSEGQA